MTTAVILGLRKSVRFSSVNTQLLFCCPGLCSGFLTTFFFVLFRCRILRRTRACAFISNHSTAYPASSTSSPASGSPPDCALYPFCCNSFEQQRSGVSAILLCHLSCGGEVGQFLNWDLQKEALKEEEEPRTELRLVPPSESEIYPYDVTSIASNQTSSSVLYNMQTYKDSLKRKAQRGISTLMSEKQTLQNIL